jgi:hypothetical protein
METSEVLDRAADLIDRNGLAKGEFYDCATTGAAPTGECRFCTVGAIRYVAGYYDCDIDGAWDATAAVARSALDGVASLLDLDAGAADVPWWSDLPETTAGRAVDVLRHSAVIARTNEAVSS